jgi:hypothetical protein
MELHLKEVEELKAKYFLEQNHHQFYVSEKEALLTKIKDLNTILQKTIRQKEIVEKELRFVLSQLEKEKLKASDIMLQIKRLVND